MLFLALLQHGNKDEVAHYSFLIKCIFIKNLNLYFYFFFVFFTSHLDMGSGDILE